MMLTEDEAREKWCPFVRAKTDEGPAFNRTDCTDAKHDSFRYQTGTDLKVVACIGSGCMAWRWVDDDKWIGGETTRRGFCGLAVRP